MSVRKKAKLLSIAQEESLSSEKPEIDWSKCCICQSKNTDDLVCPARNKDPSRVFKGYKTLADNLSAFQALGELSSSVNLDGLNDGSGLTTSLQAHEGKWHKLCFLQYNNTKLERAQKRFDALDNAPLSGRSTRSAVSHIDTKENLCFICTMPGKRYNELHDVTSLELSDRVKKWAEEIKDVRLIGMLQTSDLVAIEAKYHAKCLLNLRNRCRSAPTDTSDSRIAMSEAVAFAELVSHIQTKLDSEDHDYVFQMSTLTAMYKKRLSELLEVQECEMPETRSTTLREKILEQLPQLQEHRPSKEYHLLSKASDIASNAHSHDIGQDAVAFSRFCRALRKEMMKCEPSFTGSLNGDEQASSVPPLLLACVNMILFGTWSPQNCKATQPALTLAQLMMFNIKNRPPSGDIVRHTKTQETPLPLYLALSTYGHTRSSTVIDDMHQRGLSISSTRVKEITSSLSHLAVERAKEEGLMCPSNLRKGLFTIGAYDNIDHNPSSTTSHGNFHGTSISVFQTPSSDQLGECRTFNTTYADVIKNSTAVPFLPDSYANVPNVYLPQKEPNIPDNWVDSLADVLPKDLNNAISEKDWLQEVVRKVSSSEGDAEKESWAAFRSKGVLQTQCSLRSICALLPLFTESSTSVSMVRHGMM